MKDLNEKFYNASARIENIVLLAGVLIGDSLPDTVREFLEEESFESIDECFGGFPSWVKEESMDGESYAIQEWLVQEGKFGFLVQVATPAMTIVPLGSKSARSYSWGHYYTKWFYGDTIEEATEKGFSWVAEQHAKDALKAA